MMRDDFMTCLRHHSLFLICAYLLLGLLFTYPAQSAHFDNLKTAAKGQTVYFNAWGGDAKINSYIKWAGDIIKQRYDITLVHVKLTDTSSAVSRLLAEKTAGRDTDGTIGASKKVGLGGRSATSVQFTPFSLTI